MPIPTLLVNGFVPFPLALVPLIVRFHGEGVYADMLSFHPHDIRSLDLYAASVDRKAREMLRRTGSDRLHVVGYSAGAVASLTALTRCGLDAHVDGFVTLGGPFEGSKWSWMMQPTRLFSEIAGQLLPNSAWLADLTSQPLAAHVRVLTVSGRHDIVCPPYTAHLDRGRRLVLPEHHLSMLTSERVFLHMHAFLSA